MSGRCTLPCMHVLFAGAHEHPAYDEHRRTPHQEADVPIDTVLDRNQLIDMVNAEDLVVNKALDHIENPKAYQNRANEQPVRPIEMAAVRVTPEDEQASHDENICTAVKNTVPEGVQLQILD